MLLRDLAEEHRAQGALLQPDGIPERVIAKPLDQARTQGIGDEVSRGTDYTLIIAYRMVMECATPYRTLRTHCEIHAAAARGLQSACDCAQRIALAELQQPMRMIRHQHPRQHRCISKKSPIFECT